MDTHEVKSRGFCLFSQLSVLVRMHCTSITSITTPCSKQELVISLYDVTLPPETSLCFLSAALKEAAEGIDANEVHL